MHKRFSPNLMYREYVNERLHGHGCGEQLDEFGLAEYDCIVEIQQ